MSDKTKQRKDTEVFHPLSSSALHVLWCRQQSQDVKSFRRFGDWPCPHLQDATNGIQPCCPVHIQYLYPAGARNCVRAGSVSVRVSPCTVGKFYTLTLPSASRYFIEFCRRYSFKTYIRKYKLIKLMNTQSRLKINVVQFWFCHNILPSTQHCKKLSNI